MEVQVKDIIRAYDFKPMVGRSDCFVEGEVLERDNTERGFQAYKILVTKDSWVAELDENDPTVTHAPSRVGEIAWVPWRVSFNEYQGRVINLSR